MAIPDQRYINHVREALWSRTSRASVMIGSGFSRNAHPNRPEVRELPLWHDLEIAMASNLGSSYEGLSSCSALALAQKYVEEFGRGSLDLFLQQQVRDHDFSPGEFHSRLLKLPWRDVFTTNWDTLLERTLPSMPERRYSVVHNKAEIPFSVQPRVVKLHGSLDGHFPLIVTEDDYRTYPECHAPFVNTVQQAMMETTLILIGFSGEDPNFEKWSTWVQENLRESAPLVFLAGWFDYSDAKRKDLRSSNVAVIDLARHPKVTEWPEHLRQRYATDWILSTLERGRPYDVVNWPDPLVLSLTEPDSRIHPVETVTSDLPMEEPWHPHDADGAQSQEDSVREVLKVWAHNRSVYPGWLMVPLEMRSTFVARTRNWEPAILQSLGELSPMERLNATRELLWRYEISLDPVSSSLESKAVDALALIDCMVRTVDGDDNQEVDWTAVREAYREVALTLVTVSRHRLDEDTFIQRVKDAEQFTDDEPNVPHRICHERSLCAAWALDFETLGSLLSDWRTDNSDPIWMLRKAALLNEIGRDDEAGDLIRVAMSDIRLFPIDDRSVTGPSREAWGLWSVIDFENSPQISNRWSELASRKCDASAENVGVTNELSATTASDDPPDFDLGSSRVLSTLFGAGVKVAPAYRAVRLSEIAGLVPATPAAFPSRATAAHIMRLAADRLIQSDPELAIRLVLRSCIFDKDKTLQRVLSRNNVAQLQDDSVRRLVDDCIRVIDYSLPRRWVERIRVALEVLSRLVLRQAPDDVLGTFDYAMGLYRNRQHQIMMHFWVAPPLQNLLERTWWSLTRNQRAFRALDLLGAPIIELDGFTAQSPAHYPDSGELVGMDRAIQLPDRNDENEAQWRDCANLLLRALRAGGEPRERASARLVPIVVSGVLSETEASELADALWDPESTDADSLPSNTLLADWEFLTLPEPSAGLAEQRFHAKWLLDRAGSSRLDVVGSDGTIRVESHSHPSAPMYLEDTLWNVGRAISGLRERGGSFPITDEEREYLIKLVSQWAKSPTVSNVFDPMGLLQRYRSWALQGLVPILATVEIPESVGETVFEKLRGLTYSGISAFSPIGGLVRILPHRADELAHWLRTGLASGNRNIATGAVYGLANWLHESSSFNASVGSVPEDILRELGLIIAARRKESLSAALQVARQVFEHEGEDSQGIIADPILNGLDYLAEELRYVQGDEDAADLRWRCAQLASSMSEAGLDDRPAVVRWLEIASDDPYPEVRHATLGNQDGPSEKGESGGQLETQRSESISNVSS